MVHSWTFKFCKVVQQHRPEVCRLTEVCKMKKYVHLLKWVTKIRSCVLTCGPQYSMSYVKHHGLNPDFAPHLRLAVRCLTLTIWRRRRSSYVGCWKVACRRLCWHPASQNITRLLQSLTTSTVYSDKWLLSSINESRSPTRRKNVSSKSAIVFRTEPMLASPRVQVRCASVTLSHGGPCVGLELCSRLTDANVLRLLM